MKTGLSALFYIKNNRKRVFTLTLCIALFSATLYITDFLFGTSEKTFRHLLVEQSEQLQIVIPNSRPEYEDFVTQLADEADCFKKETYVKDAVPVQVTNSYLKCILGQYSVNVYLAPREYMQRFCDWNGIKEYEGTLPEKAGELLVGENLARNNNFTIGEKINDYTITAIGTCDNYTCFGVPTGKEQSCGILIYSDGKDVDFKKVYQSFAGEVEPFRVLDYVTNKEEFEGEILETFDFSSDIITAAGLVILSICLVVLYVLYIRERKEEWCLYQSIGYSNLDIYLCALREMLCVFLSGICIAAGIAALVCTVLDWTTVKPLGLLADYIMPETIFHIFCVQVGMFGLCNLPVFAAIHKIKTVDAIESDEW